MNHTPNHAKFWDRFGAYILDALIIGLITFAVNYINIMTLKSFWVYLILALVGFGYKPFFESKYKATIGKMALNLEVTDWNYNYISLEKSLIRSLILIIPALVYIPIHYFAFDNPNIIEATGFIDFSKKLNTAYPITSIWSRIISWLFIADIIVYLFDKGNKQRCLKDFIAKTYVVEKMKPITKQP